MFLITTPLQQLNNQTQSFDSQNKAMMSVQNMVINEEFFIKHEFSLNKRANNGINNLLRHLIYWPLSYGYRQQKLLTYWYLQQELLKFHRRFTMNWKSELLLQIVSRNLLMTLYTPKIFSLVDKTFLMTSPVWKDWIKKHSSQLLFAISTGRCNFKPSETKSFIAGDTTVRAGLWLVQRNYKKLTPLRLHFSGFQAKIKIFFNRIKLLHNFSSFLDQTPIPFNGCLLLHLPRKRFRYHEYNVQKVAKFTRRFQYTQMTGASNTGWKQQKRSMFTGSSQKMDNLPPVEETSLILHSL
jgi:hypothetical protein